MALEPAGAGGTWAELERDMAMPNRINHFCDFKFMYDAHLMFIHIFHP
ncbi:hypothetical protein HOA87_03275 [bacterium]|nr:hypothetical protein [bacterium]